jgi:hypothetical protein
MKTHSLERFFSANEAQFVAEDDPSHESQVEFSWRARRSFQFCGRSVVWRGFARMLEMDHEFSVFEREMIGEAIRDPEIFVSTVTLSPKEELNPEMVYEPALCNELACGLGGD